MLMTFFAFLLWLVSLPIILALSIFLIEATVGLLPSRVRPCGARPGRTVILIPAHNEAASIAKTVSAVLGDAPADVEVLVVADNCADATFDRAVEAGAQAVERKDEVRRGKGFALAFGRDQLAGNPPDCVIVLDADCRMSPGSIAALRDACISSGAPQQAINVLRPDISAPALVQISNFAFLIKNLIRQRGISRLGGAAPLGGTGMAFPWSIFADAPLASGNIVEDLALGIELTRARHAPRFLETARVESDAADVRDALTQRARWEHGFMSTARNFAFPLIAEGAGTANWKLFWLGLHLSVPPLALLGLLGAVLLAVQIAFALFSAVWMPAIVTSALLAGAFISVFIAWLSVGRTTLAGRTILILPLYLFWKLPLYIRLWGSSQKEWVRTRRPEERR